MIILFNGCSHTEGSGVPRVSTWANMVCKSLVRNSTFFHVGFTKSQTLSKYFKYIVDIIKDEKNLGISIARSGKGNDSICLDTLEAIENLKDINKKPDYVFIQWSGVARRLIQKRSGTLEYANPWDSPEFGLPIEPHASEISIYYMKLLESYLKLNNIEYIFLPYMEFDTEENYKTLSSYKNLDFSKIILHKNGFGKFMDYFKKNNLTIDEQGHPTTLGHWFLAGEFLNKLDSNQNLIGYFDFFKCTAGNTDIIQISNEIELETKKNDHIFDKWSEEETNKNFKRRALFKSYKETEKYIIKKIFG